jgi:hypothetical protein
VDPVERSAPIVIRGIPSATPLVIDLVRKSLRVAGFIVWLTIELIRPSPWHCPQAARIHPGSTRGNRLCRPGRAISSAAMCVICGLIISTLNVKR